MRKSLRALLLPAVLLVVCGLLLPARGAAEEMRMEIVVGFAAGGSHDVSARHLAETLREYGIVAEVTNIPGEVGANAAAHVARQKPGSGVFLWSNASTLIFEPVIKDRGYLIDDFAAVGMLGSPTFAIAARGDAPFDTWEELLKYIEENPGEVVVGGQGEGSMMHFYLSRILDSRKYLYNYVPLAGGADVARNLTEGRIDVGHLSLAAARPLHEKGDLKVFVNTQVMTERDPLMPEIPNITEKGIDAAEPQMLCLFAPRGTAREVIERLARALERASHDERLTENFGKSGMIAHYLSPEDTWNLFMSLREEILPQFRAWRRRFWNSSPSKAGEGLEDNRNFFVKMIFTRLKYLL